MQKETLNEKNSPRINKKTIFFAFMAALIGSFGVAVLIAFLARDWFFLALESIAIVPFVLFVLILAIIVEKNRVRRAKLPFKLEEMNVIKKLEYCYTLSRKRFFLSSSSSLGYKCLKDLESAVDDLESARIIFYHLSEVDTKINFHIRFYRYHSELINFYSHLEKILRSFPNRTGYVFEDVITNFMLEEGVKRSPQPLQGKLFLYKPELIILFLNKKQEPIKCMASRLELRFGEEPIFACPWCKNMAKEFYLVRWLAVKGVCPLCGTKITLKDCYPVQMVRQLTKEQEQFSYKIEKVGV